MKIIRFVAATLFAIGITAANAQSVNRAALISQANTTVKANGIGAITGPILNSMFLAGFNSMPTLVDANTFTALQTFSGGVVINFASSSFVNLLGLANGGTNASSAAGARLSSALNIDEDTSVGDANYQILATDRTVDTSIKLTQPRVWTLPTAASLNPGQSLSIVDRNGATSGANYIGVTPKGSDTINGGTTAVNLNAAYGVINLTSDGVSKWAYTISLPKSGISSFQGNNFINFFNVSLQTNLHKKIMFVGNETVWNANAYFAEICNYLPTANVLSNLGITPCNTTVSGYQVLTNAGSIKVSFSGSVPSGYTVGDLIMSLPTSGGLTALVGSGVITSIGSNYIIYTLLPINTYPSSGSFVSSGGYVTNSIINLGFNNATSTSIASTIVPLLATYAKAGDLIMMRGPIIEDIRTGLCNLTCATNNITSLYASIIGAIPATTDIGWRTENSFLTTDPTSSGLVTPLGSSSAYTKILQQAVVNAFSVISPRAVIWDDMQLVYTKLGNESATSAWMTDIVNPSALGEKREAAADVQIIIQAGHGTGFNPASLSDPYINSAANGAQLNGSVSWLASLRAQVGFFEFLAEHASTDNYSQPWNLYPDTVLNPNGYDVIAYGNVQAFTSSAVSFSAPTVNGIAPTHILGGDLIWLEGSGVVAIPQSFAQSSYNNGGTIYGTSLSSLGAILPSSIYTGQPIVVVRQHSYIIYDVPRFQDPVTWSYRHRINIVGSGTNFLNLQFLDVPVTWPNTIVVNDVIDLPCGEIPLSGSVFVNSGGYAQVQLTGSWGACTGQNGWVFGQHQMENQISQTIYQIPGNANVGGVLPNALTGQRNWRWPDQSGTVVVGGVRRVLGTLRGANFNTTVDQVISILPSITAFSITDILITNCSSAASSAIGGFYPAASKAGTPIVASSQAYTSLTGSTVILPATVATTPLVTRYSLSNIYLSLSTPQGSATSCDVYIMGVDLT